LSDLFSFLSFFLISHTWLSLKIYDDYVHNFARRKILKIFAMFFLLFSLMFILFYFFIL
jgi:succinate dehydrogenase hydrophobic anchor subunit